MTCKRFSADPFESDIYLVVNNMLNVGDVQSSGRDIRRQKNTTGNAMIKTNVIPESPDKENKNNAENLL